MQLLNLQSKIIFVVLAAVAIILFYVWFKGGRVYQDTTELTDSPGKKFSRTDAQYVVDNYSGIVSQYLFYYPSLSKDLVLAVILKESKGNNNAIGKNGEYGSMQVKQIALSEFDAYYSRTYTLMDLLNIYYGIEVGMGYLNLRFMKWKDIDTALRAYNQGDSNKDNTEAFQYLSDIKSARLLILDILNG